MGYLILMLAPGSTGSYMDIVVDASPLVEKPTGIQTYVLNMIKLLARIKKNNYTFYGTQFSVNRQQKWDSFWILVKRHLEACSDAGRAVNSEKGVSHGTTDCRQLLASRSQN